MARIDKAICEPTCLLAKRDPVTGEAISCLLAQRVTQAARQSRQSGNKEFARIARGSVEENIALCLETFNSPARQAPHSGEGGNRRHRSH